MKKDNIDKLTDKAFMRLLITSVLAICLCVVCLCSTTWAWFTDGDTAASNSITASQCLMVVTIDGREYEYGDPREFNVDITAGGYCDVAMTIPANSASGYCIIEYDRNGDGTVTDDERFYTQQVSNTLTSEPVRNVSFRITSATATTVKIIPRWGISSYDASVSNGQTLDLDALMSSGINEPDETATVDTTDTEETEEPSQEG